MLAPVVLFAFNRSFHLDRTLQALNQNLLAGQTDLIIYADGAKRESDISKIKEVRKLLETFAKKNNFRQVIVHTADQNKGLAKSIIEGVTETINQYGKVIVLEDDLITSKDFLTFMNEGLSYYCQDNRVGAVSGFALPINVKSEIHDVYCSRTGNSIGWGTWKSIWDKTDWEVKDYQSFAQNRKEKKQFDSIQYGISKMLDRQMQGEIDSWAVIWDYHFFRNSLWTIYPYLSKIQNIGFGIEGTNSKDICDSRRAVAAQEGRVKMEEFSKLSDLTVKTAKNFRPVLSAKIRDLLQKKGILYD